MKDSTFRKIGIIAIVSTGGALIMWAGLWEMPYPLFLDNIKTQPASKQ